MQFYFTCRQLVSFLVAQGHAAARYYPLGYMFNEAVIARRRVNRQIATEVTSLHSAMVAVLAGGDGFAKLVRRLTDGDG